MVMFPMNLKLGFWEISSKPCWTFYEHQSQSAKTQELNTRIRSTVLNSRADTEYRDMDD
jgi:hypothetical protein